MFKVFDLFSGAGGMSEGFLQAGFNIPYATDKSEQAYQTYINRHHQLGYNTKFYCGDVFELSKPLKLLEFLKTDLDKIDVICGGPPCQGFSLAGKRDPDDIRNKLVASYIKILHQVQPKYFVMENVIGILSAQFNHFEGVNCAYEHMQVIDVLKKEFTYIGYPDVEIKVLDASDFGVPQKRLRVFFLGTRSDIQHKLKHPIGMVEKISSKQAIHDLSNIKLNENMTEYRNTERTNYQYQCKVGRTPCKSGGTVHSNILYNHQTSNHSEHVVKRFSQLKQGENIKAMIERLGENGLQFKTNKNNCKRMLENEPSPTVLTLPDDLVHYQENRILTVREMARLQSFDDSFEFLGKRTTGGHRRKLETPQYTLVGNAVPPLLAYAVAKEVMNNLLK